jgi:hypothetical protein
MKPILGKIRTKEFEPGYKQTRGIVVHPPDSRKGSIPVLLLPIEGNSVGGLEPWMVDTLRQIEIENWGHDLGKIAAAIEEILKEADDE